MTKNSDQNPFDLINEDTVRELENDVGLGFDDIMTKGKCKGLRIREYILENPWSLQWYVENKIIVLQPQVEESMYAEIDRRTSETSAHYEQDEWESDWDPFARDVDNSW